MFQWQRIHLPVQETRVWSLSWEDVLEEEMATRSNMRASKIPWTEEPDRLQSMGSDRTEHTGMQIRMDKLFCWWEQEIKVTGRLVNLSCWNMEVQSSEEPVCRLEQ